MNRASTRITAAATALVFGAAFVTQAGAQSSGGQYRIDQVVIAGGGGPLAGGNYLITSTLGQPATDTLSGGGYVVFDGFWAPLGGTQSDIIFADGFESN